MLLEGVSRSPEIGGSAGGEKCQEMRVVNLLPKNIAGAACMGILGCPDREDLFYRTSFASFLNSSLPATRRSWTGQFR